MLRNIIKKKKFFFFACLFDRERDDKRYTERVHKKRELQAEEEREAGSLMSKEPHAGLYFRTPGS